MYSFFIGSNPNAGTYSIEIGDYLESTTVAEFATKAEAEALGNAIETLIREHVTASPGACSPVL